MEHKVTLQVKEAGFRVYAEYLAPPGLMTMGKLPSMQPFLSELDRGGPRTVQAGDPTPALREMPSQGTRVELLLGCCLPRQCPGTCRRGQMLSEG